MIPALQPESRVPARVRLSDAYADDEITTQEYVAAQRVAELEEKAESSLPFCRARWEAVRVGDVVLLPWRPLNIIIEARIETVRREGATVFVEFTFLGERFLNSYKAFEPAYVQQR